MTFLITPQEQRKAEKRALCVFTPVFHRFSSLYPCLERFESFSLFECAEAELPAAGPTWLRAA